MLLTTLALLLSATPDLPLPPGAKWNPDGSRDVNWDRLALVENDKPLLASGHVRMAYVESEAKGPALWKVWEPVLTAKGWRVTNRTDGFTLAKDLQRVVINVPEYDATKVTWVEIKGEPMKLELQAPAAKAPTLKDTDDFPFAPKFAGQKSSGGGHSDVPFIVAPGTDDARFIADASESRQYAAPKSLSRREAVVSAADGLKRAGWDVAFVNEEDGYVQAHFTKNGRDVWMQVSHKEDGTDQALTYSVVDLGGDELGKALDKDCKATLRGVNFDFNKATLKSESEATLGAVAAALSKRAKLKVVVAGHTDSVGDDASNQKLSEARAATVVAWLKGHGVAADRLAAKGFGETQPVADNETDAGRAKNRRVEVSCSK
ncbi:MAG: OmpA family protein [Myxococcaceae bacterium]